MAKISSFEELEAWKKAVELCELVYNQTNNPTLNKDFALRDQLRKSAISIPSNIAEGFEREGNSQFIYFLVIAKGSCGELRTQLYLTQKIGYIDNETHELLKEKCITISKQLSNFIKYLKSAQQNSSKPSSLKTFN
ncbi:MAG: four helix bundle protein [Bacteroidetes bacterium]|nr:four helix bundle protein [Bacteroidota bacterium]